MFFKTKTKWLVLNFEWKDFMEYTFVLLLMVLWSECLWFECKSEKISSIFQGRPITVNVHIRGRDTISFALSSDTTWHMIPLYDFNVEEIIYFEIKFVILNFESELIKYKNFRFLMKSNKFMRSWLYFNLGLLNFNSKIFSISVIE